MKKYFLKQNTKNHIVDFCNVQIFNDSVVEVSEAIAEKAKQSKDIPFTVFEKTFVEKIEVKKIETTKILNVKPKPKKEILPKPIAKPVKEEKTFKNFLKKKVVKKK